MCGKHTASKIHRVQSQPKGNERCRVIYSFLASRPLFSGSKKIDFKSTFLNATCKDSDFVKSQMMTGELKKRLGILALKLLALPPSSAGIERAFPLLGYIHSDECNRLGQKKAGKLASIMRILYNEDL